MTHHMDPRQIEASLAQDRAQLASTVGALRNRLSPGRITQDAVGLLQDKAAGGTRFIDQAMRSNPLAVLAVGAGVAWLALAKGKHTDSPNARLEAMSNWEDDGGPARPSDDPTPVGQKGYAPTARAGTATGRAIEDHPLLMGTVFLGLGAAIAAFLPRTQTEDRAFGPERKRMQDQATAFVAKSVLRG